MTRGRMTLDELEARRALGVRNLGLGSRGYAMKAVVAHDVLTQDMPALLALARAVERMLGDDGLTDETVWAVQAALIEVYAAKEIVP